MKKYYYVQYHRLMAVRVIRGMEQGFRIPRKKKKQIKKAIEENEQYHFSL